MLALLIRWVPVLLAAVLMVITVMTKEYARVRLTIPLTIAIGLLAARWYTSKPQHDLIRIWSRCSKSRRYYYGIPLVITVVLSLFPSLVRGHLRIPSNHDELAYHLAADTFCHGRLANPTPSGWEHFESFHINLVPAYCSKYQPGMGLILALGQVLGHTYFGVMMALLVATLSMSWMYRYWLPLRWAFLASILSCFPLCSNWGDFYFVGGPLAVIASAVLFAIAKQLERRSATILDGARLAGCLVLFFWTRPFEGGLIAALVGIPIMIKQVYRFGIGKTLTTLLPAGAMVLLPAIWFQVQFNNACTGSYTTLPYLLHEQQYGGTPLFLFQPQRAVMPDYKHDELKAFHEEMLDWHQMQRDPARMQSAYIFKFGTAWSKFYCLLWILPIGVLPELLKMRVARQLLLLWCVLMLVLIGLTTWFLHHYAAPGLPIWTLVIVMSIRIVRLVQLGKFPIGRFICVLLVTGYCCQVPPEQVLQGIYSGNAWVERKHQIEKDLMKQGGQHLVLVQYGPKHNTGNEWVYNSADIPRQQVIWARSMGKSLDQKLAAQYSHCRPWLLQVDVDPDQEAPAPVPYP